MGPLGGPHAMTVIAEELSLRAPCTASVLTACDDNSGVPIWSSSTQWRRKRFDVESAADEEPGDRRVRVPHLACVLFVTPPDGCGYVGDELEQAPCAGRIGAETLRARDRLIDVGDHAVAPAADLVSEEREVAERPCANRTFSDDSTLLSLSPHRCLLDHEPGFRHVHLKRGVIKVAGGPVFEQCCAPFEDLSVQAHRATTRAERQPVQIDACGWDTSGHWTQRPSSP